MGLGVLLGFFLVSIVFGTLETIRGNSPDAYREALENRETQKNEVAEKEIRIRDLNLIVGQRDGMINEKNATIAAKNATIAERDATIAARNATIAERDATIVARNATIAERDTTIVERGETILEQDQRIRELGLQVNNLEQQLRVARRTIGDRERDIDRQGRRINFLMQENVGLRAQLEQPDPGQQQPSPVPPRAEILEDLETSVS
jgi:chromosome segregation ATPase